MEQVLDVYKRPYDKNHPVICMDEGGKQLIGQTRTPIEVKGAKGVQIKEDYEYKRNGVCNIFVANEPLNGKRYAQVTDRKTKSDWAKFIRKLIDEHYSECNKVTVVLDNLKTHTIGAFYDTFSPKEAKRIVDKIEFVFTPKHGSWLNMAEIELNVLGKQCLSQRIADKETLQKQVDAWVSYRNAITASINWQFTTEDARIKLKRLYPTIEA
ncbi:hypothetical protein PEPS_00900 [Persicobacter psychrovividus]|uniref:Tc1-like transposase DDE domain-containing protein n=2 Tax=Persicobacter psychrovividus TaxID=387638 RepID=A0ABN6L421_9BACT|nr:hypothetical protein PEPS_00900 [Persicobacter psychrovividus]